MPGNLKTTKQQTSISILKQIICIFLIYDRLNACPQATNSFTSTGKWRVNESFTIIAYVDEIRPK